MFFHSIKFRLPGVKTSRVPSCFHFCFLWIKTGTRISVGEVSQNHQFQIRSRSLTQTCCTSSTVQHDEEQDRWEPWKDGRTSGSTKPTLISPKFSLLPIQMIVCANTLLILLKFLSLNEFMLITKNKLNEPCLSPYALHALPRMNLHTLYSLHSF